MCLLLALPTSLLRSFRLSLVVYFHLSAGHRLSLRSYPAIYNTILTFSLCAINWWNDFQSAAVFTFNMRLIRVRHMVNEAMWCRRKRFSWGIPATSILWDGLSLRQRGRHGRTRGILAPKDIDAFYALNYLQIRFRSVSIRLEIAFNPSSIIAEHSRHSRTCPSTTHL